MKETGFINKLGVILDKFARTFSQFTVLVMVLTVIIAVIMRYFLKSPLVWGDELAKYSLVYMTFIGASVALRDKGIAAMELLVEKLPLNSRKISAIIVYIMEVVLLAFLFYNSIMLLNENSVQNQISPALQIPMSLIYLSLPIGMGLMVIQAILLLMEEIIGFKNVKETKVKDGGIEV